MSVAPFVFDFDFNFARELRELREQRGIPFEALAATTGISRTYLQDLAAGRRGHSWPSERVVAEIARALDVEPDHFLITRARAVLRVPKAIDAVYAKLKSRAA